MGWIKLAQFRGRLPPVTIVVINRQLSNYQLLIKHFDL